MKKQKYIDFISAIMTTVAITLNYNRIYKFELEKVHNLLIVSPVIVALIFIFILNFYKKFNKQEYKNKWIQNVMSLIFSITMVVGNSFKETKSFDLIFKHIYTFLMSIVALIGYYILFNKLFQTLNCYIEKIKINEIKFKEVNLKNKILNIFEEKPFISSFCLLILFWSIFLIAFYPGVLNYDSHYQILQALNIHTKYSDWVIQLDPNVNITNHHPVIYTLFLGKCFKIGQAILNDNFGIFIATFIQINLFAATLSYTIKYLKKIGISSKIRAIVLGIYCIVPMFPFYAITNVKDTIYTSLIIIYIIKLYDFIKFYKNEKLSIKQTIIFILLTLSIILTRNNGIYVVVLSFIFDIFYSKVNLKKMLIIFMACILSYVSYSKVILTYFKIPDTSIREMLSVPFQQTARYVKEYGNELTDEEKEAIDKILKIDDLAKRYKPEIADPVKNEYNKYATKDDLKEYFKVWLNGLKKHPVCYIESFVNNTYAYMYPSNDKWYLYYGKKNVINNKGNIDYHYIKKLQPLRNVLAAYGVGFRSVPGIGLISNIGFNTWLVLIMGAYFIIDKEKRKFLIVLLPHLISFAFCLLSPVNNYFRYPMPYIFAMPITIIFFLNEINSRKEEKDGKK